MCLWETNKCGCFVFQDNYVLRVGTVCFRNVCSKTFFPDAKPIHFRAETQKYDPKQLIRGFQKTCGEVTLLFDDIIKCLM